MIESVEHMPTIPKLEWSDEAKADLLAIIDHISDDSPQAAQDMKDEIENKVNALPVHPKKYAKSLRVSGYRQLTVSANYLVFYRLLSEQSPQVIDVVAVVHARKKWP